METLTISRKQDLLQRAALYHHTKIFLQDTKDYVQGVLHEPVGFRYYQPGVEPVVDAQDLYDLGKSACLTVNKYNALVLNTRNMLIADIDFGDARLNRHAGAKDYMDVGTNLCAVHLLDTIVNPFDEDAGDFRFADQSYRLYRTHSGCRVICTSICVPWKDMGWIAQRFMRFLRSDPDYIKLCEIQECYRARLTPKPWRDKGDGACVCRHISTEGGKLHVAPELEEQLRLHDELTLPENDWADLA